MSTNSDPQIEALNLNTTANTAAYALKEAYPDVIFTSGRRDTASQADAMASNIVDSGNRNWIEDTYASSVASGSCQDWVTASPQVTTEDGLSAGLCDVLDGLTDEELADLSKHLSGDAFDVQPVDGDEGDAIKAAIEALPGLTLFLDEEGGLVRWHAEF